MKILVTGGAGFIGSNFVRYQLEKHPDDDIVNLDLLTYAGNLENLSGLEKNGKYSFIKADIADKKAMDDVFRGVSFDAVVNFAAETHVDRSIHMSVDPFIRTNIQGTQNLLDLCREHGVERYMQVSTDEVYGALGPSGIFTEDSPLQPNNPYAATKAGADMLVRAAGNSHGINAVISRCSNNFGPYQFPEKLIPLMIANAMEGKELPVYGDGLHVRDWIYVLDHCSGVDLILRKAEAGSIYNISSAHDVPNIEVVKGILKILGKDESLIKYVEDRPGHDRRYALDASKLRNDLGWKPSHSFENALKSTVEWYVTNREWWERIRSGEYMEYYSRMYGNRGEKS